MIYIIITSSASPIARKFSFEVILKNYITLIKLPLTIYAQKKKN